MRRAHAMLGSEGRKVECAGQHSGLVRCRHRVDGQRCQRGAPAHGACPAVVTEGRARTFSRHPSTLAAPRQTADGCSLGMPGRILQKSHTYGMCP